MLFVQVLGIIAAPAGIVAGVVYDTINSKGIVAVISKAKHNPIAGNLFDVTATMVVDVFIGISAIYWPYALCSIIGYWTMRDRILNPRVASELRGIYIYR